MKYLNIKQTLPYIHFALFQKFEEVEEIHQTGGATNPWIKFESNITVDLESTDSNDKSVAVTF